VISYFSQDYLKHGDCDINFMILTLDFRIVLTIFLKNGIRQQTSNSINFDCKWRREDVLSGNMNPREPV
jgi:hypothetical protein